MSQPNNSEFTLCREEPLATGGRQKADKNAEIALRIAECKGLTSNKKSSAKPLCAD
jgi:hypothetical protein